MVSIIHNILWLNSSKANAFAICLSDVALEISRKEDPCSSIMAEVVYNAHDHQYSSFLCMLALSSVLKFPIECFTSSVSWHTDIY